MDLLLAVLVFMGALRANAAEVNATHGWPVGIDAYQKSFGNCPPGMPEDMNLASIHLSKEYQAFIREQACRTNNLRSVLEKEPAKLCPGMKLKDYLLCYEQTANKMAAAEMLDVSSLRFLAYAPLKYILQNPEKEMVENPVELILLKVRLHWVNLRLLERRTTPTQLRLPNRSELAALKKGDVATAKAYALVLLREWKGLLDDAEKALETPRGRTTVNGKNRLLIARQEFQRAANLWKKR